MTFYVGVPRAIDDTMVRDSNVLENDYAAWSAATNYALGDRVISTTTHLIYESAQAGNLNRNPTSAANVPTWWLIVGATNKFRPFDGVLSSLCERTGRMKYQLVADGTINTMAFFGLTGSVVTIAGYDTDAARRNLLTKSWDATNAVHTSANVTLTANSTTDHLALPQATGVTEDTVNTTHIWSGASYSFTSGTSYTFSIYVKRFTLFAARDVRIGLPNAAFTASPRNTIDLGTGAVTLSGGATGTATLVGSYWRCSVTATADVTTAGRPIVNIYNGATSYLGNGNSGIFIEGPQVEVGAMTAYQWIDDAATFGDVMFNQSIVVAALFANNSKEAVFTGIVGDTGDIFDVNIEPDVNNNSKMSELVMANSYALGTVTNSSVGIIDYSTKTIDTFGTASVVKRSFANKADYTIVIPKDQAASTRNFLGDFRARALLFYDTVSLVEYGLTVYGFWKEFDIPLTGTEKCFMTLSAEGII